MKRECETCVRNKLIYCPSSIDCLATDDKPYYQNRIMLLEENWKLKKQLEEKENQKYKEVIDKAVEYIEKHLTDNGRFLMLNEWQVPDLLKILKEVE